MHPHPFTVMAIPPFLFLRFDDLHRSTSVDRPSKPLVYAIAKPTMGPRSMTYLFGLNKAKKERMSVHNMIVRSEQLTELLRIGMNLLIVSLVDANSFLF